MSRFDRPGWFERGAKRAPPEHGIKMKKAGTTWWGQRWIGALELVLRGDAGRLSRGRTYARRGRTHDFEVQGGKVKAKVTGSRPEPYDASIELKQFSDAEWDRAIEAMAAKAQFAAELLAGRMPQAIDEVFREVGVSLFPAQRKDLVTDCSCPDWGDPCKHVAATHYVLGEALDRDPFLLFELRGRGKQRVLEALRAARSSGDAGNAADADPELAIPAVTLERLAPSDYDRPREALPALALSFSEPETHGTLLRQLGAPGAWGRDAAPAELLAPLVRAAAEKARGIALGEGDAGAAGGEPGSPAPLEKRAPHERGQVERAASQEAPAAPPRRRPRPRKAAQAPAARSKPRKS